MLDSFHLPHCLEKVVGIHERMDAKVHDNKPPSWSSVFTERVPTVNKNGNMVIPENWW